MISISNEKAKTAADICKVLTDIVGKPADARTANAVRMSRCVQKYLRKKIADSIAKKEKK